MSYDGQALKIWAIDENRGEAMLDIQKELSEKEPKKLAALRSSLIEFDKVNAHLHLSDRSSIGQLRIANQLWTRFGIFQGKRKRQKIPVII